MKKGIAILVLAALLSGCAQTDEPAVVAAPSTSTSAVITERETSPAVTSKATSQAESTTPSETKPTATTTTTTAPVSATTAHLSATEAASRTTTQATTTEPVSAQREPVSATTTRATTQTERPTERTTRKVTATAKPMTTTTAKPSVTTTTKITVPKPPIISKTTTTAIIDGITYVEVPNLTCLATMIENLEETDTTPYYYIQVGKKLKHDGTDYGKAVAVYNWTIKNGWGSCVYHALETYYVCQGIGLECAYAFCTDNGWYGHTYNAVKVEGTWYVLDTQGHTFLDNTCHWCKRMFDGSDQDLPPYDEWIWYPFDQYGEYRNWTVEPAE